MKVKFLGPVLSLTLLSTILLNSSCATTSDTVPAEAASADHEKHHPDQVAQQGAKQETKSEKIESKSSMGNGEMKSGSMMGNMDMGSMKEMMNHCMQQQKDKKMCNHEVMNSCQEKMDKQQCTKMMNEMKADKGKK